MESFPETTPAPEVGPDQKNWAMLAHLAALSGYITAIGFILGPILVWAIKRSDMEFVDDQGKEAINFNISVFIYAIVSAVLILVLVGVVLLIALGIFHLVMVIVAAINASSGTRYRYPLTIRFVR